jgi:hypothetical protein
MSNITIAVDRLPEGILMLISLRFDHCHLEWSDQSDDDVDLCRMLNGSFRSISNLALIHVTGVSLESIERLVGCTHMMQELRIRGVRHSNSIVVSLQAALKGHLTMREINIKDSDFIDFENGVSDPKQVVVLDRNKYDYWGLVLRLPRYHNKGSFEGFADEESD